MVDDGHGKAEIGVEIAEGEEFGPAFGGWWSHRGGLTEYLNGTVSAQKWGREASVSTVESVEEFRGCQPGVIVVNVLLNLCQKK